VDNYDDRMSEKEKVKYYKFDSGAASHHIVPCGKPMWFELHERAWAEGETHIAL
jgi:hypothetical protein